MLNEVFISKLVVTWASIKASPNRPIILARDSEWESLYLTYCLIYLDLVLSKDNDIPSQKKKRYKHFEDLKRCSCKLHLRSLSKSCSQLNKACLICTKCIPKPSWHGHDQRFGSWLEAICIAITVSWLCVPVLWIPSTVAGFNHFLTTVIWYGAEWGPHFHQ